MMSLAYERASHLIEMARLEKERLEAACVPAAPTQKEIERQKAREWARERDREIWLNHTWPEILRDAVKARARAMA